MASAKKGDVYGRFKTLRSMFSNHYEIHSFGYGFGGWVLSNAVPSVEPTAKIVLLSFIGILYGFNGGLKYLPVNVSREDIPVDIKKQKHYFLFGVTTAFLGEKFLVYVLPLLI